MFRLRGLGFFAKLDDVLVERAVVAIGLVKLAEEVVDVGFEVVAAVPGAANEVLELEDVVAGFVAGVQDVLFGDVELLPQGGDGNGCVVGVSGSIVRVRILAGASIFVGWRLRSVLRLLEVRPGLERLGTEPVFALPCGMLVLRRGCSSSAAGL